MKLSDPEVAHSMRADFADRLVVAGADVAHTDSHELADIARSVVAGQVEAIARAGALLPAPADEDEAVAALVASLFGLGKIDEYLADPTIENVAVNGPDTVWLTFADGTKARGEPVAQSESELIEMVSRLARRSPTGERRFDAGVCELHLQLPDGSRLFALREVSGPVCLTIRKHRFFDIDLDRLEEMGAIGPDCRDFLEAAVQKRKNLLVAGPMNSGKTTMLRGLASAISPHERVVTVEEDYELGLERSGRHPDLVALQARPANTEGVGAYDMAHLVRNTLRMSADRVIVGEVRGAEVVPMLNAMSQGRAGSMCTMHADSSDVVFARLASYAMSAPEALTMEAANVLAASAVHFVVYVHVEDTRIANTSYAGTANAGRLRRYVSSVREVSGLASGLTVATNEIFRPGPDGLAVPHAMLTERSRDELSQAGYDHQVGSWAA